MSFSISSSTNFSDINWDTLENRPQIDTSKFCTERVWYENTPCCMNGFEIEHVLHVGNDNGYTGSEEAKFLEKYPCLNGPELDSFFEKFSTKIKKLFG